MGLGKYAAFAVGLALLAAGCRPPDPEPEAKSQPDMHLSDADALAIAEYAKHRMEADEMSKKDSIAVSTKVPEIDAMKNFSDRVEDEGVYIRKSGFFGKEHGFFVPRDPATFEPSRDKRTSYVPLGHEVYRYEITR